jgi:excisionase family DNA binding protein
MSAQSAKIIQFPQRPGFERALTAKQLAEALGMSERWIAYRVAEGMPSHRYGRARRFRMSEVEEYLRRQYKEGWSR